MNTLESDLGRNENRPQPRNEEINDSGFNVEATFGIRPLPHFICKKRDELVFPRTRIVRYNTRTV